jgi:hypothetical protein
VRGEFSSAATEFAAGDYGDAAFSDAAGSDFISLLSLQELLLGAAASL